MMSIPLALALTASLTAGAPVARSTAFQTAAPAKQAAPVVKQNDSDIADRVNRRLDTDATLHKYDVTAKVDHGVATLTGTVATAQQKLEAGRLAQVTGVTRVENNIAVDKDVDKTLLDRAKAGMSKTGELITDAWITTKVKWHFMGEDLLKGSNINVDTDKHVVTLNGTVKTTAGRARAVALARQTEGVDRVVDKLTIGVKH